MCLNYCLIKVPQGMMQKLSVSIVTKILELLKTDENNPNFIF